MKSEAVEQARDRLQKARNAISKFEKSSSFTEAESSWSDFLIAASGIYSKLEQGAKSNGKSIGWFGRKKHGRKKDALLNYIHHARNADEHGIAPTTERHGGSMKIYGGVRLDGVLGGENTNLNVSQIEGEAPMRVEITKPHVRLVRATDDRFGDSFDPPTEHLGQKIEDPTPLNVAQLALTYLDGLIVEAANLTK